MNNGLHSIDNAHQLRIYNAVYYCKADSLVRTTRIFLWPLTGFPFHVFSTTGFPSFSLSLSIVRRMALPVAQVAAPERRRWAAAAAGQGEGVLRRRPEPERRRWRWARPGADRTLLGLTAPGIYCVRVESSYSKKIEIFCTHCKENPFMYSFSGNCTA
jgi:hypothetical protein